MKRLQVIHPGFHTLLQDAGRFGRHHLGLTTGGPLDRGAFILANRLCNNPINSTALEITLGGLQLLSSVNSFIALTGADAPLWINGQLCANWQTHAIRSGDRIGVGFSRHGVRSYLAIAGGFQIPPQFGSTATVVREGIGGLHGTPLATGDRLPCASQPTSSIPAPRWCVPDTLISTAGVSSKRQNHTTPPQTHSACELRLIAGYQFAQIKQSEREGFFANNYQVTAQADRMGYRLHGAAIHSGIQNLYSEGICLGAVQITGDGQPIVLLHDRQTIGGYPKLGSVLCGSSPL